jgi:hypothetical protein
VKGWLMATSTMIVVGRYAPDIQLEERQQIARNQRDMRHRAEDQRRDQDPEGIALARARQSVAAKRAEVSEMQVTDTVTIAVLITAARTHF